MAGEVSVQTKKDGKWEDFSDNRFNVNYPVEGSKSLFFGGTKNRDNNFLGQRKKKYSCIFVFGIIHKLRRHEKQNS